MDSRVTHTLGSGRLGPVFSPLRYTSPVWAGVCIYVWVVYPSGGLPDDATLFLARGACDQENRYNRRLVLVLNSDREDYSPWKTRIAGERRRCRRKCSVCVVGLVVWVFSSGSSEVNYCRDTTAVWSLF